MKETSTALTERPQHTLPAPQTWQTILSMAETLVQSGMLPPAIKKKEAAAAVILKGSELGIPAMQAFSHIHVIQQRPTCSAELMLALLARGGVTWTWHADGSDGQADIEFRRAGFAPVRGRFSEAEAKAAELTGKSTWKQYPANMLRARAISNGARMIGPDLLGGMSYTPEELGAEVTADGEPLDVHATVETGTSRPAGRVSVAEALHVDPDELRDAEEHNKAVGRRARRNREADAGDRPTTPRSRQWIEFVRKTNALRQQLARHLEEADEADRLWQELLEAHGVEADAEGHRSRKAVADDDRDTMIAIGKDLANLVAKTEPAEEEAEEEAGDDPHQGDLPL